MEWDRALSKESGCNPSDMIDILIENKFKMFYPDFENNKYYQVSKDELLAMPEKIKGLENRLLAHLKSVGAKMPKLNPAARN